MMMHKTKVGVVISDKPQKTVVVQIMHYRKHPLYKKYLRRFTKVYAHDEKNECKVGEKVVIEESRPLSKLKRWRVIRRLV
jgi:small subunit ribosomal protein S17